MHTHETFARGFVSGSPLANAFLARNLPQEPIIKRMSRRLEAVFGLEPARITLQAIFMSARKPG